MFFPHCISKQNGTEVGKESILRKPSGEDGLSPTAADATAPASIQRIFVLEGRGQHRSTPSPTQTSGADFGL